MKVLFLGSSSFSVEVLKVLLKSRHEVVAVVCQPDRPSGRGHKLLSPEIKSFAEEKSLKVLQFEKVNNNLDEIFALDFDVFVTASFGQIISREFLSRKLGLNVHPSKLPKYRGATPLQTAIMNGDKMTGVTIQKMEYEVDSGDVIKYEDAEIFEDDTFFTLSDRTAKIGGRLLSETLDDLQAGKIQFNHQKGSPTFTRMIKKEDGLLDFNRTADEIVNKVRALAENPGCYFFIGEDRIKVQKTRICTDFSLGKGEISVKNKRFLIGCKDGAVEILFCQAPNGKMLSSKDFLNGYRFKSAKVNECF